MAFEKTLSDGEHVGWITEIDIRARISYKTHTGEHATEYYNLEKSGGCRAFLKDMTRLRMAATNCDAAIADAQGLTGEPVRLEVRTKQNGYQTIQPYPILEKKSSDSPQNASSEDVPLENVSTAALAMEMCRRVHECGE